MLVNILNCLSESENFLQCTFSCHPDGTRNPPPLLSLLECGFSSGQIQLHEISVQKLVKWRLICWARPSWWSQGQDHPAGRGARSRVSSGAIRQQTWHHGIWAQKWSPWGQRRAALHHNVDFITRWVCVCACSAASDSCSPVDCSWPCSSIHGASQARILEQVVFLPDPGTEPTSPALAGGFVTTEPPAMSSLLQVLFFCCCSVSHLCLTLYDSMDCSMPGFPVFHYLPEFAQTHVFWIRVAI